MSIERIIAGCIILAPSASGELYRAAVNGGQCVGMGLTEEDALSALLHKDSAAIAHALLRASDNAFAAGFEAGMKEVVGNER